MPHMPHMPHDILPQAVVVIVPCGGSVVLVKRAPSRPAAGYWTPVTGRIEHGESPVEAGIREVKEEIGLPVELEPEPFFECRAEGVDFWLLWYAARAWTRRPSVVPRSDEIVEARWVGRDSLDQAQPMFDKTREGLLAFWER